MNGVGGRAKEKKKEIVARFLFAIRMKSNQKMVYRGRRVESTFGKRRHPSKETAAECADEIAHRRLDCEWHLMTSSATRNETPGRVD